MTKLERMDYMTDRKIGVWIQIQERLVEEAQQESVRFWSLHSETELATPKIEKPDNNV